MKKLLTITALLLSTPVWAAEVVQPTVEIVTSEMVCYTVGDVVIPEPVVKEISEALKEAD